MMKLRSILLILFTLCLGSTLVVWAHGTERGMAEATIKGKKIMISYGRPSINGPALKGRDIFEVAPVGTVWRLGKDAATTIETTGDLVVAGKTVKAGKYTLWAKRTGDKTWILAFHPKTTNDEGKPLGGGTPMTEGYVAELPLTPDKASQSAEHLTIEVHDNQGKAHLMIHFGNVLYSGGFEVK